MNNLEFAGVYARHCVLTPLEVKTVVDFTVVFSTIRSQQIPDDPNLRLTEAEKIPTQE
jgi:hypothetical protein